MNISTRIRSFAYRGEPRELPSAIYYVRRPSFAPCPHCGGVKVFVFDATTSGACFSDSFLHEESCLSLSCEHGVLWDDPEDCKRCEALTSESDDDDEAHWEGGW